MYGYFTVRESTVPLPPLQGLVQESGAVVIRASHGALMYVVPEERADAFEYTLEALAGPNGYTRNAEPMSGYEYNTRDFTDEFMAISVL